MFQSHVQFIAIHVDISRQLFLYDFGLQAIFQSYKNTFMQTICPFLINIHAFYESTTFNENKRNAYICGKQKV